jgi:hypothetical protein
MVPGSTFIYGSSFWIVTERPLASNNFPKDAETIPFPSEDVTPPVTNIYFVGEDLLIRLFYVVKGFLCLRIYKENRIQLGFILKS